MHLAEFVNSYFDAWNHRNPEEIAAHLARNGRYCDIPQHGEWTHDELIGNLEQFFATFQHRYELAGQVLASRNTIAFQYRMIPQDNGGTTHEETYLGAEFITLRNDAALLITDYYEVAGAKQAPLPPAGARPSRQTKYAKSGLNEDKLLEYKQRLDDVMGSKKLFMQSGLTLPRLAEAVDCSVNHLSQVINAGFDMSFFDYLNRYRVNCAREMMTEADDRSQAILNIAYTVGFNSISAFYSAFKKHVGQTPARFRREQLKKTAASSSK